jgi:hypothetical protein
MLVRTTSASAPSAASSASSSPTKTMIRRYAHTNAQIELNAPI